MMDKGTDRRVSAGDTGQGGAAVGVGVAAALMLGTLARLGNIPGGWLSVVFAAAIAGLIAAFVFGAMRGSEKPTDKRVGASAVNPSWLRPTRWLVLLAGVACEWAARYFGSPIWLRLAIIAATIALLILIGMALNTATLSEEQRRQKARSMAIAGALFALVGIFYAATIVRLGPNALNKDGSARPAVKSPAVSGAMPAPGSTPPTAPAAPNCKQAGTC